MRRVLTASIALALLAACNQPKNPQTPERFPGFTQAGKDGEASRFYADLNSVARKNLNRVSFKLVRVVDGGHVIQDAMTDCRSIFQAAEGMKYREDGTSDSKYPGDSGTVNFKQQAGLNALAKLVCNKAEEGRMIVGAFDDIKALEILYGPYRAEANAALWQGMAPQKNMVDASTYPKNEGLVRAFLSKDFSEGGVSKRLLLTATNPNSLDRNDCRACAPLIGAAIFARTGDKWQVETHYPYLGTLGAWGKPPAMSWVQIGKEKFALLTESADVHQGIVSAYVSIDLLSTLGLKSILNFLEEEEGIGKVSVAFATSRPEEISDVVITIVRETEKQPKTETIHRYRFANDKYEKVS